MMKRFLKFGIILVAAMAQAEDGQVYLMTGTSTPKRNDVYDSTLLRVNEDGSIKVVANLMPDHDGTEWIGVSYDWRKAVFLPKLLPTRKGRKIVVVDFDKAAVVKRCEIPEVPGVETLITQWLADVPIRGPAFEQHLAGQERYEDVVQSMTLDPSTPCGKSFENVDPSEVRYMVASGTGGVAGMAVSEGLLGSVVNGDGRIRVVGVTKWYPLPYEIPAERLKGLEEWINVPVLVNNPQLLVVCVPFSGRACRKLVFRKRDKAWQDFPVSGELTQVRAFGGVVAVVEGKVKNAQNKESAGRAAWRKERSRSGPAQEEWFDDYDVVYPGRLHLYDSDTGRAYTIVTNQGDSEIVLVEDNTIYYRVSDRLYSAAITSKGLGEARLLAAADEIRDAHWAFIARK